MVLYALLALAIGTPLVRKARLSQIPDLGDPFDVAAFAMAGATMPFRSTRKPCHDTRLRPAASRGSSGALYGNRVLAVQLGLCRLREVQAWINSNREASDLWLRATARPGLSYHPWDGRGFGAEWFDGGEGIDIKTGKQHLLAHR